MWLIEVEKIHKCAKNVTLNPSSIYYPYPILAIQKPLSQPISPAYGNIVIFTQGLT